MSLSLLLLCCSVLPVGINSAHWSTFYDNKLDLQGLIFSDMDVMHYLESLGPIRTLPADIQEKINAKFEKSSHLVESYKHDEINPRFQYLMQILNESLLDGPLDGNASSPRGVEVASLHWQYVKNPFIICIWVLIVSIFKLGFHHTHYLSSIFPESCLLIVLGVVVGAILQAIEYETSLESVMTPRIFFLVILPPIILESAYSLHDRTFVDNLGTILIFAVLGTLVSCFIIGSVMFGLSNTPIMWPSLDLSFIECLIFSSLIVAVDPVAVLAIFQEVGVNNVLYFLVFGESLLNDAVTVVIYNMMKTFYQMESIPMSQIGLGCAAFLTVSLGGLTIGLLFGVLTALLTKYTKQVRVVEPIVVIIMAYTSYIAAELFHFSGIISIIGCGLLQAHYSFHNIHFKSEVTVVYVTKMISSCADSIIFLFLGLAVVTAHHEWNVMFILWACILCFVTRFLVVYSFTYIANRTYRLRKINLEEQFIMAYGGLRGAVAFSLVNLLPPEFPKRSLFETTTLAVILFTVFLQGMSIKPLVKLLRIKLAETDDTESILQEINSHVNDHILAGIEEISAMRGKNAAREWLGKYDTHLFKKWFQREPQSKDDIILQAFTDMQMNDYYKHLSKQKSGQTRADSSWYNSDYDNGINQAHVLADLVLDGAPCKPEYAREESRISYVSTHSTTSDKLKHMLDVITHKRRKSAGEAVQQVEEPRHDLHQTNIHEWVATASNYHQRYDPNLTHTNYDLWHRLHDKRMRQSRCRTSYAVQEEEDQQLSTIHSISSEATRDTVRESSNGAMQDAASKTRTRTKEEGAGAYMSDHTTLV